MPKTFLYIVLIIFNISASAQTITKVTHKAENDYFLINYELDAERPARVRAFLIDLENNKKEITEQAEGDIGWYVLAGKKKMIRFESRDSSILKNPDKITIELEASPFIEMIFVEGGSYLMGCTEEQIKCDPDEKRVHRVSLDDFYMSTYEISNAQYSVFLNMIGADPTGIYKKADYIHINKPSCQIKYKNGKFLPKKGKENYPVIEVTWFGAQAFCEWAGGRLPTEAEWEYAARGGQQSKKYLYSGSNKVNQVAWYDRNSNGRLHKKGQKEPNELGIYDMSGNVWEWCYDWYDKYSKKPQTNPFGPKRGHSKVIRGGSWLYYGRYCRVANRGSSSPHYCFNNYGFRLARKRK
jgi:formylglycine-generating enzyme required for sulfatase activity